MSNVDQSVLKPIDQNVAKNKCPNPAPITLNPADDESLQELKNALPDRYVRSKVFATFHWILYFIIYGVALSVLAIVHPTYMLSHRIRFFGIITATIISLEPPYDWNDISLNFIWELIKPPGSTLRIGNPIYVFNRIRRGSKEEIRYVGWKSAIYLLGCIMIDIGGVSASVIADCCQLIMFAVTYWFTQMDSMVAPAQLLTCYDQAAYIIALFWFGPAIVQTFNHITLISPSAAPSKFTVRAIFHMANMILHELRLLRNLLRSYHLL